MKYLFNALLVMSLLISTTVFASAEPVVEADNPLKSYIQKMEKEKGREGHCEDYKATVNAAAKECSHCDCQEQGKACDCAHGEGACKHKLKASSNTLVTDWVKDSQSLLATIDSTRKEGIDNVDLKAFDHGEAVNKAMDAVKQLEVKN